MVLTFESSVNIVVSDWLDSHLVRNFDSGQETLNKSKKIQYWYDEFV
jgi:hypothetical protein